MTMTVPMSFVFHSRTCWALLAAMLVALLMPGCSTPLQMVDAPRQIEIKPTVAIHPVYFAAGETTMSPAETDALRSFMAGGRLTKIQSVTVVAADNPVASARGAQVDAALTEFGYTHTESPAQPGLADNAVAVVVKRIAAVPPACPQWQGLGGYDPLNAPMSNLGCANATNLYLMVADPRDLVSGRTMGPVDAQPGMIAVDNYRNAKPDGLVSAGTGSSGGGGGSSGGSSGQ
jgi:pilus assembly protein CpaD